MQKKTLKYYLKFIGIGLLLVAIIAFVIPAIIYYGSEFYYRMKNQSDEKQVEKQVELQIDAREKARNQGILLDETPEELLERAGVIYYEGDSIAHYYASKTIKVKSNEDEFRKYCSDFFGTEADVKYIYWAGECYGAKYHEYTIVRTELFNPEEKETMVYYVEDVGMEGMTCSTMFFYDATGKYAMIKYGDNDTVIAKFLGLILDGKDADYNPFVYQKYEKERKQLDEMRAVGEILDSAPEELTKRTKESFDGTEESLYMYFGASEPVKILSDSYEFELFCRDFFFDHPNPIRFFRSANETTIAMCGDYSIYRTEYFNPSVDSLGHLNYKIDGLEDGMSLITDFVYDPTGKYAMTWYNWEESSNYVLAKFIGLQFTEEIPYVSPIQEELEKLSMRSDGTFGGDIWKYAATDSIVRVKSDEEEFVEYCDEFFEELGEKITYWKNRDDEISTAECGDYIMLRTQDFDPEIYRESLVYEDDSYGDAEPLRSKFFYDCTGKYALVYKGIYSQDDCQNQLCMKFLGF